MELEGKIIQINPLQTGEGKNGTWKKQEFVVETKSQYPKKVCITAWGDKIDQFGLNQDEDVKVSIELESREYNSRWYTDVRAWKVEKMGGVMSDANEPEVLPPSSSEAPVDEDLPF
jgi:hypothetical protein